MQTIRMLLRPIVRPLLTPIRRYTHKRFEETLLKLTDLVPATEISNEDVFIVAYPRSGITWFQNLVVGTVYGMASEHIPDRLVQELVPDVHRKRYYKRYSTPMFYKSHHLPRPEYRRVIYLLRDGRDAMTSYYFYESAVQRERMNFLSMVQTAEGLLVGKWHEHVEAWLANPFDADMIVIRYEDLLKDTAHELQKFCEHVGIERTTSLLNMVAEANTFEKMRQREKKYGWDYEQWPTDKYFVRRGKIGSHKDEMPPEVLEAFLQEATDTLHKCGYAANLPRTSSGAPQRNG